ncbi:MAG: polysaccharide biosynthesis protein [Bradyrhizobiaceae bacterium]|nr:MAG: polysaccharide biosynthesis protein [Bradyrhizobiaceae bacterium]
MKNPSLALYFGSRAISAAGNLVSVAVFARLVGPAEYGAYILMFAWAIVVYGFATQWMKFSYFGIYRAAHENAIIASYIRLVALAIAAVSIVALALIVFDPSQRDFIFALVALFVGMTIYEAALEISRTRLQVTTVALSMICRAVFVLALGCVFLAVHHSAFSLALGVAAGHLIAAVPTLARLRSLPWTSTSWVSTSGNSYKAFLKYGWPLIFSFGIFAIGQTIDRFLIGKYVGNAVLGPYGVVADLMRQSFLVVGESIALALITIAKKHADEGRRDDSDAVMRSTFRACVAAGSFGAAFFIVFGHGLTKLFLGAEFAAPVDGIIPIFAVAFGFMLLRSFYFGQVIYFTNGTLLELFVAAIFVLSSSTIAFILVPGVGPLGGAVGGAIALLIAHAVSCVISALVGRRLHAFPVDVPALLEIPAVAALCILLCWLVGDALPMAAALAVQVALLAAAAGFVAWRFDLMQLVMSGYRPRPGET